MTPALTAFGEPDLWTRVYEDARHVRVRHPNGVMLQMVQGNKAWLVIHAADPSNGPPETAAPHVIGVGEAYLGQVPRINPEPGLAGARADVLRVAGPEARQAMDRLLLDICCWVLSLPHPWDRVYLLRTEPRICLLQEKPNGMTQIPLIPDHAARLQALQHVLVVHANGRNMTQTDNILLDMPTTAHGALTLPARQGESA